MGISLAAAQVSSFHASGSAKLKFGSRSVLLVGEQSFKLGNPSVTKAIPAGLNSRLVTVRASLEGPRQRRRIVDVIRLVPALTKNYFRSPFRRALFGGISLLGGFFVAQTISLSFGAVGVNDVIASAVCVLLTEYITQFYFTRERPTFSSALLNNFKMGFTYGLFIDAFKLGS